MAYIGNVPADTYVSLASQHFTVTATTAYTLSTSVTSANEIALFINNVRQEPGSGYSYTAVGTTLTLSAATAGTDTMYCVYLGKGVGTISPPDNSVNSAKIVDGSVTNSDLAGAITSAKITSLAATKVTGTIDSAQIAAGSVDLTHLSATGTPSASLALKGDFTWGSAGGPSLGSGNELLRTNSNEINQNVTIPSGTNASSVGPISVGASYSVAVNGVWAII